MWSALRGEQVRGNRGDLPTLRFRLWAVIAAGRRSSVYSREDSVAWMRTGNVMAKYKYAQLLHKEESAAYDKTHHPGSITPDSGIYRCEVCGWEVVSERAKPFPPQDQHTHPQSQPILWRLAVFAVHLLP
jgi:hypothetical protein